METDLIGKAVYFSESHRVRLVFDPDGSAYVDVDHLTPSEEVERMILHANLRGWGFDYKTHPIEAHKRFVRHYLVPLPGIATVTAEVIFSKRACSPNCPTCAVAGLS